MTRFIDFVTLFVFMLKDSIRIRMSHLQSMKDDFLKSQSCEKIMDVIHSWIRHELAVQVVHHFLI